MASGRRGHRRGVGLPRGPRLGHRGPVRRQPRRQRQELRQPGWLCQWRGRVRRGLLRRLTPRGRGHGPPAAHVAGAELGGVRARRHRRVLSARQPCRGVRRLERPGLRGPDREVPGGHRGLPDHRHGGRGAVRPDLLHLRLRGTRGHPGHRVLLLTGRAAPGHPGPAQQGVHAGARRWCHDHGYTLGFRRVQQAARARPGRPVQGVLGVRGRHGLVRGRRAAGVGAAVRRPPQGPPGARRHPRLGDQPGRCLERSYGPERSFAAAGDPPGAGQRGRARGGDRRGGGARHGHDPGRSH